MKSITKLSSIFLCLLMVAMVFAMPVNMMATDPIPNGVVSYWRLDEGSGNVAGDSADGNDGSLISFSSGPIWTAGQIDSGLEFDGIDDYVEVVDHDSFDMTDEITIEFWVYHNDISLNGKQKNYFCKQFPSSSSGYTISRYSQDNKVYFQIGNGAQWAAVNVYTSSNIVSQPNKWYHIAGTYDGYEAKIYVDGTLEGTQTISTTIQPNNLNIRIGDAAISPGYQNGYINGIMDEVAIYNRALTSIEIEEHWNNGLGIEITSDENTVGLWHFDDGIGITAIDSSNNDNHGTLLPITWTAGQVGSALNFDGVNDYVEIPDDDSLDMTDEITIEFWVYHNDISLNGKQKNYFCKQFPSSSSGYAISRFWEDNRVYFQIGNGAQWAAVNVYTSSNVVSQPNKWYHIAGTYNGDEAKIYVDGVLEGTHMISTSIQPNNLNIRIGDTVILPGFQNGYINGRMDEVAIWSIALTDDEIQDHYLSGLEGKGYFLDPEEAVEDLFEDLQIMNLPEGTENSLLSKLDTALNCLDNGNDQAARNVLNAFINSVSAQSGKKLTVAQADQLIAAAESILDTI